MRIAIAVKYCGNCNPEIDAPRIIGQWMKGLGDHKIEFQPKANRAADLLVIICGCRKACVDRPEIRAMGKEIILIRGGWIDGLGVAESELKNELLGKVESMRGELRRNVKMIKSKWRNLQEGGEKSSERESKIFERRRASFFTTTSERLEAREISNGKCQMTNRGFANGSKDKEVGEGGSRDRGRDISLRSL